MALLSHNLSGWRAQLFGVRPLRYEYGSELGAAVLVKDGPAISVDVDGHRVVDLYRKQARGTPRSEGAPVVFIGDERAAIRFAGAGLRPRNQSYAIESGTYRWFTYYERVGSFGIRDADGALVVSQKRKDVRVRADLTPAAYGLALAVMRSGLIESASPANFLTGP